MPYRIVLTKSATKELDGLPLKTHEQVVGHLRELEENPRVSACIIHASKITNCTIDSNDALPGQSYCEITIVYDFWDSEAIRTILRLSRAALRQVVQSWSYSCFLSFERGPAPTAVLFHRIIGNRLFSGCSEGVAIALFDADKFRADHAVLATVQENKRTARPARRLKVRVIFQHFKFGSHKEQL